MTDSTSGGVNSPSHVDELVVAFRASEARPSQVLSPIRLFLPTRALFVVPIRLSVDYILASLPARLANGWNFGSAL